MLACGRERVRNAKKNALGWMFFLRIIACVSRKDPFPRIEKACPSRIGRQLGSTRDFRGEFQIYHGRKPLRLLVKYNEKCN